MKNTKVITVGLFGVLIFLAIFLIFYRTGKKDPSSQQTETPTVAAVDIQNNSNTKEQPAYLIRAYSQNNKNYIDVDYIQVLRGKESIAAQIASGECTDRESCYDFPNSLKVNENPLIRTFEVSPTVFIKSSWHPYPEVNFITFSELKNFNQEGFDAKPPFQKPKAYITIVVKENVVTNIDIPYQE